jgi:cytochrome c peroxidase
MRQHAFQGIMANLLTCGSGVVIGLAVIAWVGLAPHSASAQNMSQHGALEMDEQMTRLDALLLHWDVTQPHRKVDAVIWQDLVPEDNKLTPERVALGRKLYFDKRLSRDGTVACATCHDVSLGFTDQRPVSEGIGGQLGRRNAPTTLNALLMTSQFLDGRAPSLEEQAKLPIVNPIEMGQPNQKAALAAIAAFERTLVFLDAPFDRFLAGDTSAISTQAQKGWQLFNGKASNHWH